jgi:hypothetical protein
LVRALGSACEAALSATGRDPSELEAALSAAGMVDAGQHVAQAHRLRDTQVPELDAGFREEHASAYADALKLTNLILSTLDDAVLSRASIRRRIVGRALSTLTTLALGGYLALWTRAQLHQDHATASSVYENSPKLGAASVIDGDLSTEWVLPNRVPGWVEIQLGQPIHLKRVRIVNGRNPPYDDRSARKVRITAFPEQGAEVDAFLTFDADEPTREVPLDVAGVQRVRVDVLSFEGRGGAIAEVELLTE